MVCPVSVCHVFCVFSRSQKRRRGSGLFAGKQGFITLRDLFKWAERYRYATLDEHQKFFDWDQLLADNGTATRVHT